MSKIRKALTASAVAGIGSIVTAWPDGVTASEIGTAVGVAVAAALAVYGVRNARAR